VTSSSSGRKGQAAKREAIVNGVIVSRIVNILGGMTAASEVRGALIKELASEPAVVEGARVGVGEIRDRLHVAKSTASSAKKRDFDFDLWESHRRGVGFTRNAKKEGVIDEAVEFIYSSCRTQHRVDGVKLV
jgi:hypothetical protein